MARRNAFHENMDSASSLLNDYNHAEEKARQFFSQENFEKSAEVWNEAARLAALLERDDLLSRAHRHCGFSYHGMDVSAFCRRTRCQRLRTIAEDGRFAARI